MTRVRYLLLAAAAVAVFLLLWLLWPVRLGRLQDAPQRLSQAAPAEDAGADGVTTVYAHNLELRKGPEFRIYVRWLRGRMLPTAKDNIPSLDDEGSFVFAIDRGLIHANMGDIETYLNAWLAPRSPLKQMRLTGDGQTIRLSGILHKLLVPLPIELVGTLSPAAGGKMHFHVDRITVLKMPMKGLLGGFHVEIGDIVGKVPMTGVEVKGNDLLLDTTELLPPPHVRGQIAGITVKAPDITVTYGETTPEDDAELARWHNFLRLRGGSVAMGKLVMHQTDLTLIDASDDTWFDLDLAHYRQQMQQGYSRMTAEDGVEMYMPDVGKAMTAPVPIETLRDRRRPLPAAVSVK